MTSNDLRSILTELGITRAELARLIGVTARAVTLWMSDKRGIPGPVIAYVRVMQLLPPNLRQMELNNIKQKGTDMRDGMFGISFQGQQGAGMGVLVFDDGRVYTTLPKVCATTGNIFSMKALAWRT